MTGTLDEDYLSWLYNQVDSEQNGFHLYWSLLTQLHTTSFTWFVPNDDNRAEDGLELRYEFKFDAGLRDIDDAWLTMDCSILEMMVALSRRVAFDSFGSPASWFWVMIDNLELKPYDDSNYSSSICRRVTKVLDRLVNRMYTRNGVGGLFPLAYSMEDQREVEIWYQMSAYLLNSGAMDEVL